MECFKRGLIFWAEIWRIVRSDRSLLKPSLYAAAAGLVVSLVGVILIGVSFFFLGDRSMSNVITGFLGAALIGAQIAVGYIFSAMTVYLMYSRLAEGDGNLDQAREVIRRDWLDILSLSFAVPMTSISNWLSGDHNRGKERNNLAGLTGTAWIEATFLILPAMVIEDVSLKNGLDRVVQLVREHVVLMGLNTVGVRLVNDLVGLVMTCLGLLAGWGAGRGLIYLLPAGPFGTMLGISGGVFVASLFFLTAIISTAFMAATYHTCLFLWARDVERARQAGMQATPAPLPLAAALGWQQNQAASASLDSSLTN